MLNSQRGTDLVISIHKNGPGRAPLKTRKNVIDFTLAGIPHIVKDAIAGNIFKFSGFKDLNIRRGTEKLISKNR